MGDKVSVVPPTAAAGRDQEPFVGVVTKATGNARVTVKTFEARARGKEVPAAWVFLNNTFMTPASGNRPRLDMLPHDTTGRLKAKAAKECEMDLSRSEEEYEKLRVANGVLQNRHEEVVHKLSAKAERRREAHVVAAGS